MCRDETQHGEQYWKSQLQKNVVVTGLQCLTPLSTIFKLYLGGTGVKDNI